MSSWRAWYTNGREYCSTTTSPIELPYSGALLFCTYFEPPYRECRDGGDWYWWDGYRWQKEGSVSWDGTWVDPPSHVPKTLLKKGVATSDEEMSLVWKKAKKATCPKYIPNQIQN